MLNPSLVLSALASVALLSNPATALAIPDSESTETLQARAETGISVQAACNIFYGIGFSAVAEGNGCNDWVCVRGRERYGLDLLKWCQGNYGGHSSAKCPKGVNSWVCLH